MSGDSNPMNDDLTTTASSNIDEEIVAYLDGELDSVAEAQVVRRLSEDAAPLRRLDLARSLDAAAAEVQGQRRALEMTTEALQDLVNKPAADLKPQFARFSDEARASVQAFMDMWRAE